jgi:hypothetical protein
VVESAHGLDPSAIRVDLLGEEISFLRDERRVSLTGPQRGPTEEKSSFLEASVPWGPDGQEQGGFFRLPFAFALPPNSLVSLRTGGKDYLDSRIHRILNRAMFVEYTLTGVVAHPRWVDQVEYKIVHVVSAGPLLGTLPNLGLADPPRSIAVSVNPTPSSFLADRPVTGFFQVLNPQRAKVERLSLSLFRRIDHRAQDLTDRLEEPRFEVEIELAHDQAQFAGQFSLPVPVSPDVTPPMQGALFSSQWVFRAELKGGLWTQPVAAEGPVIPPSTPLSLPT